MKVCAKREASGGPCGRRSAASPVEVLDHKKLDPNVHELTTEDNLLRDFLIATLNTCRAGPTRVVLRRGRGAGLSLRLAGMCRLLVSWQRGYRHLECTGRERYLHAALTEFETSAALHCTFLNSEVQAVAAVGSEPGLPGFRPMEPRWNGALP